MVSESIDILLEKLGDSLQRIRLNQNLTQETVAERSGLSYRAILNLETGRGVSLRSFLAVCRTLNQLRWVDSLTPPSGPSPMELLKLSGRPRRQRASSAKRKKG